jgi:hypothetical protein
MKAKIYRNANYIGWVVIILTFIFIYFSYFFIYIPKKEALLEQKSFRILKEYGSNMLDKNKYYENHFKNYGLYYSIRHFKEKKLLSEKKSFANNRDSLLFEDIKKVIADLQQYVVNDMLPNITSFAEVDRKDTLFLNFPGQGINADSVKRFFDIDETSIWGGKSIVSLPVINKVPIDKFMEGLKFDELFENIAFFDMSGVYYNSKTDNLVDISNPGALIDSTKNTQGGIHKTLNFRGEKKHVIILPIDFKDQKFFIAGFITDTDYRNKTRTLNHQLLIYIAGILMLVFVGMPILKIIFIDPLERLKATDAVGSGISIMFGIGLLIIIMISLLKSQVADRVAQSGRIHQISNKLNSNFNNDINAVKKLYSDILWYDDPHQISTLFFEIPFDLPKMVAKHFESDKKFKQIDTLKSPFQLNEIILINSNGIVKKAVTRTAFSEVVEVNLSERQYFKNAANINNSWPTEDGLNFYIESIKSYNTGKFETAVSFHTSRFGSLPVMAVTSAIPSLYDQVLPNDAQFVIIENSGKVLYHSKKDKNLHENFIQECESNLRLIKAIESNIEKNIKLNYDEKKWLARIVPIKDTPLFHITLLDLNQNDNHNARIFLVTFYFFIFSLIFMVVALLSIIMAFRPKFDPKKKSWIFKWIILQPDKYNIYKALTSILAIIAVFQFSGVLVTFNPAANLIYQFVFILFTLFVTLFLLTGKTIKPSDFIQLKYLPVIFIFSVSVLLILIFLQESGLIRFLAIPLLMVLLITLIIPRILKYFASNSEPINDEPNASVQMKIKTTYLAFLFLWLTCLSAVPVVQYYFSVKKQEGKFCMQEQFMKVARDNLKLLDKTIGHNAEWLKRVQGNGIDYLNVSYKQADENFDSLLNSNKTAVYENMYTLLPNPITTGKNYSEHLNVQNYVNKWFIGNTLYFRQGIEKGAITVTYSDDKPQFVTFWYILLVIIVFSLVIVFVWFLLKYLAKVILNLNQEEPFRPGTEWVKMLENNDFKKIILNTFNGETFLKESQKLSEEKIIGEIKDIHAAGLISSDFTWEPLLKQSPAIIWIYGFKQVIFEFDKHEKLLSQITWLCLNSDKKIVLDLSFEIDLINEFYDEYIATGDLKPEQIAQIFILRGKWNSLYDGFIKFNGYLNLNVQDTKENRRIEDDFKCKNESQENQFSEIWGNLTSYEKIVLFDLSDDGLMNRKNTDMVQALINKRLIKPYPYPAFFSDDFRDFVRKSIKSNEIKTIEAKLGLKGRWHNARYLILLIIIPLTAFVLISQGMSIEKIFGIFAGGIAAVSGLMRLFDSSIFKQTSQ